MEGGIISCDKVLCGNPETFYLQTCKLRMVLFKFVIVLNGPYW